MNTNCDVCGQPVGGSLVAGGGIIRHIECQPPGQPPHCPHCFRPIVTEPPGSGCACITFCSAQVRRELRTNLANAGNGIIEDAVNLMQWYERRIEAMTYPDVSAETGFVKWPIDTMDGAAWNILDSTGARIACCGFDNSHGHQMPSLDGERIASAIIGRLRNIEAENYELRRENERIEKNYTLAIKLMARTGHLQAAYHNEWNPRRAVVNQIYTDAEDGAWTASKRDKKLDDEESYAKAVYRAIEKMMKNPIVRQAMDAERKEGPYSDRTRPEAKA